MKKTIILFILMLSFIWVYFPRFFAYAKEMDCPDGTKIDCEDDEVCADIDPNPAITKYGCQKGGIQPIDGSEYGLTSDTLPEVLDRVLLWVLGLTGPIILLAFIFSGFMYFTSGGDQKKAELAKKMFLYSLLGTVIILSSLIIVNFLDLFLKGEAEMPQPF